MISSTRRCLFALMILLLSSVFLCCEKEPKPQNDDDNEEENPIGIGLFSVSDSLQVTFAPGNLAEGGCSFVQDQLHLGGYFGWGSGNHPDNTSIDYRDYLEFHDWGDNIEGGWRTMSLDEWKYIVFNREQAQEKYAAATVKGKIGLVLLPDNWTLPEGCQFWPGLYGWERNQYSLEQWQLMERAGAVFLLAGGYRWGTEIVSIDRWGLTYGNYWLSTQYDENDAYYLYFIANLENQLPTPITNLAAGMQVRLVRDKK